MLQKNWQELIKPNRLDVSPGTDSTRMATIVVEPLERGFAMTLGNSLRRVLLSSLQGAAVTTVQIDGDSAPPRSPDSKAIFVPSGDQAGEKSQAELLVRLVWPEPSAFITYISSLPSRLE